MNMNQTILIYIVVAIGMFEELFIKSYNMEL